MLLLIICYLLDDFSYQAIFETMFWVGASIIVVGGAFFGSNNPYMGASMAITTQLRTNPNGQESSRSNSDTTEMYVRGILIAIPGIIMAGTSYFVLA